ncbi:hypothetical protein ACFQU7_33985 [Pseudoroseomonas wenyumeiae]
MSGNPGPHWRRGLAMLAVMLVPEAAFASPSARKMEELCRPAAMAAEIDAELPQGVLLAIAHVESGRRDPASGATIPWPWTINAEGVPMVFNTREEAVAAVQELQGRNIRSIDVGCMQVNLQHHPDAFPAPRCLRPGNQRTLCRTLPGPPARQQRELGSRDRAVPFRDARAFRGLSRPCAGRLVQDQPAVAGRYPA